MVKDELADVLSGSARTMVSGVQIQCILGHLVYPWEPIAVIREAPIIGR